MAAGNFAGNRVFSFSQLFCFFLEFFFFPKFTFSGPISFLINVSLFSSAAVTVNMDYEENMENARYATNDDTPL
jgi:hypothetical protein